MCSVGAAYYLLLSLLTQAGPAGFFFRKMVVNNAECEMLDNNILKCGKLGLMRWTKNCARTCNCIKIHM